MILEGKESEVDVSDSSMINICKNEPNSMRPEESSSGPSDPAEETSPATPEYTGGTPQESTQSMPPRGTVVDQQDTVSLSLTINTSGKPRSEDESSTSLQDCTTDRTILDGTEMLDNVITPKPNLKRPKPDIPRLTPQPNRKSPKTAPTQELSISGQRTPSSSPLGVTKMFHKGLDGGREIDFSPQLSENPRQRGMSVVHVCGMTIEPELEALVPSFPRDLDDELSDTPSSGVSMPLQLLRSRSRSRSPMKPTSANTDSSDYSSPVRGKWSVDEMKELVTGVNGHGVSHWQKILLESTHMKARGRRAPDLKDKWRNLLKQKRVVQVPSASNPNQESWHLASTVDGRTVRGKSLRKEDGSE